MSDTHLSTEQASQRWSEGKAAFDSDDFQTAWTIMYGLYGAQIADAPVTQATLALQIGICCRRLGRWDDAASWLNEAMGAPGADADIKESAERNLRQVRLENSSAEHYDLDDGEGNITTEEASRLWNEGKAAFDSGDFQAAWTTMYGLYGAQVANLPVERATLALQIGICCRRLGQWDDAASWLNEAMAAPGADGDIKETAEKQLRQVRLENSSADFYDLDDGEGNITTEQASRLWNEGKAAFDSGDFQTAWTTMYGLYGAQISDLPVTRALLAYHVGVCSRRLGNWNDASSWLNEAMSAPGADSDLQTQAAAQLRQVRLENAGEFYDLDDEEH